MDQVEKVNKKCIICNIGLAQTRKKPYCKECRNKKERENYNSEKDRERHLKYWYGITIKEYKKMFISQNGQCAICGRTPGKEVKRMNVDHNHKTGKVRSLLCTRCNLSIGLLEDEKWILKAKKYLKLHE